VIRSGRTVTVCRGEVLAFDQQGDARAVLEMLATMMTARDRGILD
jgi:acyl-coenzyme A thioesterase PaaI-like protein